MAKSISFALFVWTLAKVVSCQYDDGRGAYQPTFQQHNQPPPASILLHKQALARDGSFNYAFAADNGLRQGEIISPDGSRKGSYSYVDPNGKTVSLSYTAGKDGFRILNGDHVPKAPDHQRQQQYQQQQQQQYHPQQQLQQQAPQLDFYQPQQFQNLQHPQQPNAAHAANGVPYEYYKNAPNAPAYKGNAAAAVTYENPYGNIGNVSPQYRQPIPGSHHRPQPRRYDVQEGNYDAQQQYRSGPNYQDRQKPHSFGEGFAFEFAGK